jgi:putative tricarboxylic transport membrane protein
MLMMGVLGYVLRKLDFETAPIVLGVVLAPMIELAVRQSLAMSDGHYGIFFQRPIAATLLVVALGMMLLSLRTFIRHGRDWRARLALAEKGES